jgi:hypothetical protein
MSANVYNVIWADDECATLSKDFAIRKLFDEKHIEILQYVPTSEALKIAIERYKDKVDAVIIDGNFSRTEKEYVQPNDISGLIHTLTFIDLFNTRRDLPFFLYTGKKVFLQEFCINKELDYFIRYKRLFQKGDLEALVDKIVEDVEHIKTVEFWVRKKNKPLLNMAKEVDKKCAEYLLEFLNDEARDFTLNRAIDMFSQLRKILERIHQLCINQCIVPEKLTALNQFGNFFFYSIGEGKRFEDKNSNYSYKSLNNIMPAPIAKSLKALIEILQDGSHNKDSLHLSVSEYVNEVQTPFLFRACLYLVMDLLKWYHDTSEKLMNNEITPPFYLQEEKTESAENK